MSIITRADLEGSTVIGVVGVRTVSFGTEMGIEGVGGWVRSKPVEVECNQKFEGEPMRALRWGWEGMVEDIVGVRFLSRERKEKRSGSLAKAFDKWWAG
jgi:hypothetical protein